MSELTMLAAVFALGTRGLACASAPDCEPLGVPWRRQSPPSGVRRGAV